MSAPRNLVNLAAVGKGYAARTVLRDVTLGVAAGDRIGVVGRNGEGKSTLLRLIAGLEEPDAGAVTRSGGVGVALLAQGDDLDPARTVGEELIGDRAEHEWAGDPAFRSVLDGLLGGVELRRLPQGMATPIAPLSGGERRRVALARLLLDGPELLLLDEPTNHLDVEGVDWLARHLAARRGSMLVVTHDRWFLDAVCTATWEVADGDVHRYDGGYAAYVLARAERERVAAVRRSAASSSCARSSPGCAAARRRAPRKPKFRIEAANALIEGEPEPRDRTELLRFASARLGSKVLDAEDVSLAYGPQVVLRDVTWRLGPGDRVALVGVNGSGKSSLIELLAGEQPPGDGTVERGATVRLAHLSQDTAEIPGHERVLESLEAVRMVATLGDGAQVTAGSLAERFGFRGERARTLVRDLSGGERRRLQLMRLLMGEPNVLLLDEPTNDLDIDTLTALEDLLDGWPGTLVVVSHDRYFVERVCDDVYALEDSGGIRHLPGGIDQYIAERRARAEAPPAPRRRAARTATEPGRRPPAPSSAPPARRSPASSGRSTSSPRATRSCRRRWPRRPPTTCGWASSRRSSRRCAPSARRSRRPGSSRASCSRAERSENRHNQSPDRRCGPQLANRQSAAADLRSTVGHGQRAMVAGVVASIAGIAAALAGGASRPQPARMRVARRCHPVLAGLLGREARLARRRPVAARASHSSRTGPAARLTAPISSTWTPGVQRSRSDDLRHLLPRAQHARQRSGRPVRAARPGRSRCGRRSSPCRRGSERLRAQAGLWLGTSQDDYVKLVVIAARGATRVHLLREVRAASHPGLLRPDRPSTRAARWSPFASVRISRSPP